MEFKAVSRIAFLLLATLIAAWSASHIQVDADIASLLPKTAPSVQGVEALQREWGSAGRISIVLRGDRADVDAAVPHVARTVSVRDDVRRVEVERPYAFFETVAPLYLDLGELERLAEAVADRIDWERRRANPLFAGLSNTPEIGVPAALDQLEALGDPAYRSEDGRTRVVFVFPTFSAVELDRSRAFLDEVGPQLRTLAPGVDVGFTGLYVKRVRQQDAVERDLGIAVVASAIAVFLFLLLYFRSLRAVVAALLPLGVGTVWAAGVIALWRPELNLLSSFCITIMLGIGIDIGIHLLSASRDTARPTAKAVVFAALTTAIAFGSLAISDFRAFAEFGVVALIGITCVLLAYFSILGAIPIAPRKTVKPARSALFDALPVWVAVPVLLVATGVAVTGIPRVVFDANLREVQSKDIAAIPLDREVRKILGMSQHPAVVLAKDREHARRIAAEVDSRRSLPEGDTVGRVVTLDRVLPADQESKIRLLRTIQSQLDMLPASSLAEIPHLSEHLPRLDQAVRLGPLESGDLPPSLADPLRTRDGGEVVLIFPTVPLEDAREARRFARVIRGLPGPAADSTIDAASEALILVDILDRIEEELPKIAAVTFLAVTLLAFVAVGRRGFLAIGALCGGTAFSLGICGLAGISFNFLNVLVVPVWLGLGIDAAFHLDVALRDGTRFPQKVAAVLAAVATSMIGFGALAVTSHAGLNSVGVAAAVGLCATTVVFIAAYSLAKRWS